MEYITIPLSWLKGTRFYERAIREYPDKKQTASEMRERGYTVNEYTWPAIRWEKGDR